MYIAEFRRQNGAAASSDFQFNVVLGNPFSPISQTTLSDAQLGAVEWLWKLASRFAGRFFPGMLLAFRSPRWLAKKGRIEEARGVSASSATKLRS